MDDIDFFGLYDCFPICFVRAVEAVGLAPKGLGGQWVEDQYERVVADPDPPRRSSGSPKTPRSARGRPARGPVLGAATADRFRRGASSRRRQ